jgi:L-fuculose-phosphate aldolase
MTVFASKEAEEFIRTGAKEFRYSREVQITPGARDLLGDAGIRLVFEPDGAKSPVASAGSPAAAKSTAGLSGKVTTKSPDGREYNPEHLKLFHSEEAEKLKTQMCDMGRRLWMREYTDGNGGNISARIGPNEYLCTPTGVSKGFLTPDMMCMVNGDGLQIAGSWKRTSEVTTHLAIYQSTPAAMSVCHAHPVHATAFAVTGFEPPPRLIPEWEVFVGKAAMAPYKTPGSREMYDAIYPLAPKHQSILMGNHGVICWGVSVEDAYFKMEITDAYCRTVFIAMQIPTRHTSIPCEKMGELLELKKGLGLPDPRYDLKPAELCEIDPWAAMEDRPKACSSQADGGCCSSQSGPVEATNAELEALVQSLTEEIMQKLSKEGK